MTKEKNTFIGLVVSMFFALLFTSCKTDNNDIIYQNGAIPPAEAASTFELEPGFKIELIAAEPMISDPVDMEIDEYGRMYVVEMHGYPLDKSGSGKIKLLTDTDGDGKFDRSTVFADSLVLPNGIMRWKKGIIVSDAPNILYLEDTDGDGVADKKDTLLTGFSLSNPHINVNNPVYALDNWIHLSHRGAISTRNYQKEFGDEGAEIYFPAHADSPRLPKNAESRSVRFQPDSYRLEETAGRGQFGHSFDKWGHHLFGDNQNHAFAEIMALSYVKRNPQMPVSEPMEALSDHGNVSEVYQITKNPERQMFSGVGVMTSSSGATAYLGGLFPPPFDQNVTFVCESVSNLVHVDKMRDTGASFVYSRVGTPRKEFLASTDAWSRPVNLYVGPDGALYMVDYYRRIIEHPEWMSEEAIKAGGLYDGKNMGRIYRITPVNAGPAEWIKGLKLGDATSQQLVEHLADNNAWWRINAQRLLVDRNDASVVPALKAMAVQKSSAMGRLHALWTLEGMGALSSELIRNALKDSEAGIRENSIKLAEIHLHQTPDLAADLFALQSDSSMRVRFQLLCTLGSLDNSEAARIRNNILFRDINDKWIQIAALSSPSSSKGDLLEMVLKRYRSGNPSYASLVRWLTLMTGASGDAESLRALLRRSIATTNGKGPDWQGAAMQGLADGLRRRKIDTNLLVREQPLLIRAFFEHPSAEVRNASLQVLKLSGIKEGVQLNAALNKAAAVAANKLLTNERRTESVNFLSLTNPVAHTTLLQQLIVPEEDPAVQLAAVRTLSFVPDFTVSDYVLAHWNALTPAVRDVALNTFMVNPERKKKLLAAVQAGTIQPSGIGAGRSAQLMQDDNDTIRTTARKLLMATDDEKINKQFQAALQLKGDSASGRLIFKKNCGVCHQVRGTEGVAFGPDLGTVQNWLPKNIMANMLAPNLSIAVGFDLWGVELRNGESLQGIIKSETASAITLKTGPGVERVISRQEIQSLKGLNTSIMPPVAQQFTHQQMADLIAYLRQTK